MTTKKADSANLAASITRVFGSERRLRASQQPRKKEILPRLESNRDFMNESGDEV